MTDASKPEEVPTTKNDYTDLIEWTQEEEEAFLAILSKASNDPEDL